MPALPPKLKPNDPRLKRGSAEVNGRKWSYFDVPSEGSANGTIFLIHGFPDIAFAWRYQIPVFTSLGFRCIALECMGYGDTGSSSDLKDFGFKAHSDAVAGIAKQIGTNKVIVGGHDWGGAVVYRVAQWYPDLVTHVFSVATPHWGPSDTYVSTKQLVETALPNFGYQLQLGSEDGKIEKVVNDEKTIRKFLRGMYGGSTSSGKPLFTPEHGLDIDVFQKDEVGPSFLVNEEELDYYVAEFMKNGINGPCNWYRTRRVNFEDELKLPAASREIIQQPTLFIAANKDAVLRPEMSKAMESSIPNLSRASVDSSHWALWHTADETSTIIRDWLKTVVLGGKSKI